MKPFASRLVTLLSACVLLASACGPAATPTALPSATASDALRPTDAPIQPTAPPATAAPTVAPTVAPTGLQVEAQFAGSITAFRVDGDRLYLNQGPRLVTYDLGDLNTPLGTSAPLPGLPTALAAVGRDELLALTGHAGLFSLDLTDPAAPTVLGQLALEWNGVALTQQDGWAAVLLGSCNPTSYLNNCTGRVQLVDARDPRQLRPAGTFDLADNPIDLAWQGTTLWAAHASGVVALDTQDPANLRLLGELPVDYLASAAFDLPRIYLAAAGVVVSDWSDPTAPRIVSRWLPEEESFYLNVVAAAGERLAAFNTFGEFGFCGSSLHLAQITDPNLVAASLTPQLLTCVGAAQMVGDRLFARDWEGLHVVDVGDLAQPTVATSILGAPSARDLTLVGDHWLYWGQPLGDVSLMVSDVADATTVTTAGPLEPGWFGGAVRYGDTLYVSAWQAGVQIVDVSDPAQPQTVGSLSANLLEGLVRAATLVPRPGGALLAVALSNSSIVRLFDLADPHAPSLVGVIGATPEAVDVITTVALQGSDELLYLLTRDGSQQDPLPQLTVYDLRDPAAPNLLGQTALTLTSGTPYEVASLAWDGATLWAALGGCQDVDCRGALFALDVTDPARPTPVSALDLPAAPEGVAFGPNGEVFVGLGEAGVWVIDGKDPAALRLLVADQAAPFAGPMVWGHDRLYLAARDAGIYVLRWWP